MRRSVVALAIVLAAVCSSGCGSKSGSGAGNRTRLLIADLERTEPEKRVAAAVELGSRGDSAAVRPLSKATVDIRSDVRKAAIEALGFLGDVAAVDALSAAVRNTAHGEEERRLAADSLRLIGDSSAIPVLREALMSGSEGLAFAAAHGLGAIGGDAALDALTNAIASDDLLSRRAAASVLGQIPGEQTVAILRKLLGDVDPGIRLSAAENLASLRDTGASAQMVNLLLDADPTVRRGIPRVLNSLGNSVVLPLADLLVGNGISETVRRERRETVVAAEDVAMGIVVRQGGIDTFDALVAAATRGVQRERALSRLEVLIRDPGGKGALLNLLQKGNTSGRKLALSLLDGVLSSGGGSPEGGPGARLEAAGFTVEEVRNVCSSLLGGPDSDLGFQASEMLCVLGDVRGRKVVLAQFWADLEVVRKSMPDSSSGKGKKGRPSIPKTEESQRAARCLAALWPVSDKVLADRLVPLVSEAGLRGKEWDNIVQGAVRIMGKVADPSYLDPLLAFLKSHAGSWVGAEAAAALGRIGDKRAFDPIVKFVDGLINDQYFVGARLRCYEAMLKCDASRAYDVIGRIFVELQGHNHPAFLSMTQFYDRHPDPKTVAPLVHWVNHDIRMTRDIISGALAATGRKNPAWLVDGFAVESSAKRSVLAGVIADELGSTALPALLARASDNDPKIRQGVVWALGCIGGEGAPEAVAKAMADEHSGVRSAAAWAAGRLRAPVLVEGVIALLADKDVDPRAMAAKQLGDMGAVQAVDALIAALRDEEPRVRGYAAISLAELNAEPALDAIRLLLDDEDADVRAAASYAVKVLDGQPVELPPRPESMPG